MALNGPGKTVRVASIQGGEWVGRAFVLAGMLVVLGGSFAAAEAAQPAAASQLLTRGASDVSLAVNGKGEALVTYTAGGKVVHVLAWGAVNAIKPATGENQVEFQLDYAGGYGKYRTGYWQTFGHDCGRYSGPPIAWAVDVCVAPDGSNWALQAWPRSLPDYGEPASPDQAAAELHLSHWTGALPSLTIKTDWSYRRFDHLFGSLTYQGVGVHGFRSSSTGVPLDSFGRNLYVDTLDSAYGAGWKRENSFLTHNPNGTFCYGFYPHGSHPSGNGKEYRATVMGPGVTPDVMWEGAAPGPYDRGADAAANALQRSAFADKLCRVS
jgi:hypothetical protein